MARWAVFKAENEFSSDVFRWLDSTLIKLVPNAKKPEIGWHRPFLQSLLLLKFKMSFFLNIFIVSIIKAKI